MKVNSSRIMSSSTISTKRSWRRALMQVFDSHAIGPAPDYDPDAPIKHKFHLIDAMPLLIMHAACLTVIWVGWSWIAVGVAVALYLVRMFAITGFYHRYFSHKSFKTNRFWQFLFAIAGNTAAQRGPLWWAAHHRHHHKHSDDEADIHSPSQHGLFWAHMGWVCSRHAAPCHLKNVKDFAKFPELVFLDRFDKIVPLALAFGMFGLGALLEAVAPQLGTNGWQMLVWGFVISTTVLFHGTFTINSLTHVPIFGKPRFDTGDTSHNSLLLALITLGEGWHNNHHFFPASCRQGFFWWEIDITWYMLKIMSWIGIVSDIRPPPASVYEQARAASG